MKKFVFGQANPEFHGFSVPEGESMTKNRLLAVVKNNERIHVQLYTENERLRRENAKLLSRIDALEIKLLMAKTRTGPAPNRPNRPNRSNRPNRPNRS